MHNNVFTTILIKQPGVIQHNFYSQ